MPGLSIWEAMDYSHADETLSYEELEKRVGEEYSYMSDSEKYCRLRDCDPTFFEYVLSCMYTQKSNKVEFNELTCEYKIIKDGN